LADQIVVERIGRKGGSLVRPREEALDDVFTESFKSRAVEAVLSERISRQVQEGYGSAGKPKQTLEPSSSSTTEDTTFPSLKEESSRFGHVLQSTKPYLRMG